MNLDIPRDKNYPPNAGQCDACGGLGCPSCKGKGWIVSTLAKEKRAAELLMGEEIPDGIRRCENEDCRKPLPPNHVAVYCSNECAMRDA